MDVVSGFSRAQRLRQAEVQYFHGAVVADHDVGGLEVAMDDAALVCGFERVRDLPRDRERLVEREALL